MTGKPEEDLRVAFQDTMDCLRRLGDKTWGIDKRSVVSQRAFQGGVEEDERGCLCMSAQLQA